MDEFAFRKMECVLDIEGLTWSNPYRQMKAWF